jgi:hypothetical protein
MTRERDATETDDAIESPFRSIEAAWTRLTPLGWLFVALATYVGWQEWLDIPRGLPEHVPLALADMVRSVAVALLPAALLFRTAQAVRTQTILLLGLVGLAVAEVVQAAELDPLWLFETDLSSPRDIGVWLDPADVVGSIGAVLTGVGLLRLRAHPSSRRLLLVGTVLLYVAIPVASLAIAAVQPGPLGVVPSSVIVVLALAMARAFMVWPAVAAWLDRDAPRPFWALLAAGLPLRVISAGAIALIDVLALSGPPPGTLVLVGAQQGGLVIVSTASVVVAATAAVLALLAFGRYFADRPSSTSGNVPVALIDSER